MNLALVTDAWRPQINGVVTTLTRTRTCLEAFGYQVTVLSPQGRFTVPCPTYPEIRLALLSGFSVGREIERLAPDVIHIATEGPLGAAARRYCARNGLNFTTSYHTQFPHYVRKRLPVPVDWSYALLRGHHGRAVRTMAATEQVRRELEDNGFDNVVIWSRGVDTKLFAPRPRSYLGEAAQKVP